MTLHVSLPRLSALACVLTACRGVQERGLKVQVSRGNQEPILSSPVEYVSGTKAVGQGAPRHDINARAEHGPVAFRVNQWHGGSAPVAQSGSRVERAAASARARLARRKMLSSPRSGDGTFLEIDSESRTSHRRHVHRSGRRRHTRRGLHRRVRRHGNPHEHDHHRPHHRRRHGGHATRRLHHRATRHASNPWFLSTRGLLENSARAQNSSSPKPFPPLNATRSLRHLHTSISATAPKGVPILTNIGPNQALQPLSPPQTQPQIQPQTLNKSTSGLPVGWGPAPVAPPRFRSVSSASHTHGLGPPMFMLGGSGPRMWSPAGPSAGIAGMPGVAMGLTPNMGLMPMMTYNQPQAVKTPLIQADLTKSPGGPEFQAQLDFDHNLPEGVAVHPSMKQMLKPNVFPASPAFSAGKGTGPLVGATVPSMAFGAGVGLSGSPWLQPNALDATMSRLAAGTMGGTMGGTMMIPGTAGDLTNAKVLRADYLNSPIGFSPYHGFGPRFRQQQQPQPLDAMPVSSMPKGKYMPSYESLDEAASPSSYRSKKVSQMPNNNKRVATVRIVLQPPSPNSGSAPVGGSERQVRVQLE